MTEPNDAIRIVDDPAPIAPGPALSESGRRAAWQIIRRNRELFERTCDNCRRQVPYVVATIVGRRRWCLRCQLQRVGAKIVETHGPDRVVTVKIIAGDVTITRAHIWSTGVIAGTAIVRDAQTGDHRIRRAGDYVDIRDEIATAALATVV